MPLMCETCKCDITLSDPKCNNGCECCNTWLKYEYVCSDCDALIQITTLKNLDEYRGWCACGSPNITQIGVSDATIPTITDVSNITPKTVVKINSNPYN